MIITTAVNIKDYIYLKDWAKRKKVTMYKLVRTILEEKVKDKKFLEARLVQLDKVDK